MSDVILDAGVKSIVSVVVLFILTRLMGKKQISQLTFFDYVVGISIGSVSATFAVDSSIDYQRGITCLIFFGLFPITLSLITQKHYRLRKLLDGAPTVLIQQGRIVEQNLKKAKLNVNDLLEQCRQKNAFLLSDVESAVLETDGKVSVQLKADRSPLTPKDMNVPVPTGGLCINLIIDGTLLEEHLALAGRDRAWLEEELKKQNSSIDRTLLAYVDPAGALTVYPKNTHRPQSPLM